MENDAEPWGLLRLALSRPETDAKWLLDAAERLEELGAIVATDAAVGGVELRDRTTLGGSEFPELWIYSNADAVERIAAETPELAARFGLEVAVSASIEHDDSWRDGWKQFYVKQYFGARRLLLRPTWLARSEDDPSCEVVLDPGRAFGTGLHETTQLCIELLCALADQPSAPPSRAIDWGCGSGILALSIARLWPSGSTHVLALDLDADATEVTRENVAQNRLEDRIEVLTGSLPEMADLVRFDLLVANIRPETLIPAARALRGRALPRAHVVLSGILDTEKVAVATAYRAAGWNLVEERCLGPWAALLVAAPADADVAGATP